MSQKHWRKTSAEEAWGFFEVLLGKLMKGNKRSLNGKCREAEMKQMDAEK